MTTLILLTPHSGCYDNDLDQNSNYPLKNDNVLISPAGPAIPICFVWKNLDSAKAKPAYYQQF
jgi:hypothetical protein